MSFFYGAAAKEVNYSISTEPHRWRITRHTLIRDDSLEVWVGNGFLFYGLYPGGGFGLFGKFMFAVNFSWWKGWLVRQGTNRRTPDGAAGEGE